MEDCCKKENVHSRRDFLKYAAAGGLSFCCAGLAGARAVEAPANKPNVIFILGDDVGWHELGCYGNSYNETPNLDALAQSGMRFTDGYASAPVCSPFRASLMTGQVPARVGIYRWLEGNDSKYLSRSYHTMAEQFKSAGYSTGIVGKWHLSGYLQSGAPYEVPPTEHGFDENMVAANKYIANGSYWYPYSVIMNPAIPEIDPPLDPDYEDEYLIDRCNYEALNYIERHKDEPFFLYLSHYAVHTILAGKPDLVSHFESKAGSGTGIWANDNNPHLAAQLYSIDEGVGQIVAKLTELGLLENTIIVFMGDNGGENAVTTNGPLRDGKQSLYEGGVRVPLIMSWAGRIQANSTCSEPVICCDFYPTFSELTGIALPADQPMDGISLTPLFTQPSATLDRADLFWYYPYKNVAAIRSRDWKLLEHLNDGTLELYYLPDDLSEDNDLSKTRPEIVTELYRKLKDWRSSIPRNSDINADGKSNLTDFSNIAQNWLSS
ncbi:MAG: sulfatase [Phycisphaerae bacterium]